MWTETSVRSSLESVSAIAIPLRKAPTGLRPQRNKKRVALDEPILLQLKQLTPVNAP